MTYLPSWREGSWPGDKRESRQGLYLSGSDLEMVLCSLAGFTLEKLMQSEM